MDPDPSHTESAPAERASAEEIKRQSQYFVGRDLLAVLPAAVPCALVGLNAQRQIVFANDRFLALVHNAETSDQVQGYRPGEALGCVHAFETAGGCGTTEFCSTCGAVAAILASQVGQADVQECRITRRSGDALELRVWATPVTVENERFTIFAVLEQIIQIDCRLCQLRFFRLIF